MNTQASAAPLTVEPVPTTSWIEICHVNDIAPNTGVCAHVNSRQVAIFNLQPENKLVAIDNFDPFSGANVISRGIVGDVEGKRVVASPMYKQQFCLETGRCLQNELVRLSVYRVKVENNVVKIQPN